MTFDPGESGRNKGTNAAVLVVEANAESRRSMVSALVELGYECQGLDSVSAYTAAMPSPDCVVLGKGLDELNGSVLGECLTDPYLSVALVIVPGEGKLLIAPQLIERATTSVLPAQFERDDLIDAVQRSLRIGHVRRRIQERFASIEASVERLSPREKEVLSAIVNGQLNKAIARSLDVSVRTVEGDRAKIVEKFKAETTGEVVGKFAQYTLLTEMGYPTVGSAVLSL